MGGYASLKTKILEAFRIRMYYFIGLICFVFAILIIQLFNLQMIKGEVYKEKSRLNMESNIPIPATRGEIYDRHFEKGKENKVIVSNRPSFNVTMIPASFSGKDKMRSTLKKLCTLLDLSYEETIKEIEAANPWERVVIKEDIGFDTIIKLASHQNHFPNIDWEDAPVRVYNYNNMFAHVVGYIGSISPEEYKRLKNVGYKHYQKIGKSGLEKEYDALLRGIDGYYKRIVDVKNRMEGEEIGLRPVSGNNIILTLDFEIQKAAYEAMKDRKGGVVVLKPNTGEILALVSTPDYDPNQIISKNNRKVIESLSNDNDRPFLNRIIQSKYPPASTFKLVTAIASLEEEKWNPNHTFYCPGKYTLKGFIDKDFYCYAVHHNVDMYWAIAKSCSVYFYQLGYKIGPSIILKYAKYLGLGNKTGIDLPSEIRGFVPSKKWKLKTFGQQWYDGDTINLSIGQGFITVTPIAMANMVSAIVNSGVIYKPHIIKTVLSPDNKQTIRSIEKEKLREIPLSRLTVDTLTQGMRNAVKGGTSIRLNYLKIPVTGKTGTAQTRSRRAESYSQHAWYVGYAPFEGSPDKTVAIAVLIEYGVAGAATAVPVAEKIYAKLIEQGYF